MDKNPFAYGGQLRNTRRGRRGPRPLGGGGLEETLHLILRSTKAKGSWSFRNNANRQAVEKIVHRFSIKHKLEILSMANVGNHLHFHVRVRNRNLYKAFIRAVTASIAMAIAGMSRWHKTKGRFWDFRPFTRVVFGRRGYVRVRDYIAINQLEGLGMQKDMARTFYFWNST